MMRQLIVFALRAHQEAAGSSRPTTASTALRKLAARAARHHPHRHQHADHGRAQAGQARALRRAHKDIPIVIITTEGAEEDRQRALQLGANAYITKPIQAPQVIAKVKELLKID